MDGTALAVISSLPLTPENYRIALQKLRRRFGLAGNILQVQLNRLLTFKPPVPSFNRKYLTSVEMRRCLDEIQGILQNILQLDDALLNSDRIMLELILSRVPASWVLELERLKAYRRGPEPNEEDESESQSLSEMMLDLESIVLQHELANRVIL